MDMKIKSLASDDQNNILSENSIHVSYKREREVVNKGQGQVVQLHKLPASCHRQHHLLTRLQKLDCQPEMVLDHRNRHLRVSLCCRLPPRCTIPPRENVSSDDVVDLGKQCW